MPEAWTFDMHRSRPAISAFILLVIGLQASTFVVGSKYWPFMVYSMFRHSYPPRPIRATDRRVSAVTAKGEELEVTQKVTPAYRPFALFRDGKAAEPDVLGLNSFALYKLYLRPLLKGDPSAAQRLAERISAGREDPVVAFRVEDKVYLIADTGVVTENARTVTYPVGD